MDIEAGKTLTNEEVIRELLELLKKNAMKEQANDVFEICSYCLLYTSGGNVLEPSMGIGNFFGSMPAPMQRSNLYGVCLLYTSRQAIGIILLSIQMIQLEKIHFSILLQREILITAKIGRAHV